jgi:RNA polymerase sigma-70 factor (ECF subfamily)
MELDAHLVRRESGRLVAALTRIFGVHNIALAEDVVQEVFVRALEVWKVQGAPDDPPAWLMTVAKRRAIDVVRQRRREQTFAPELGRLLDSEWTLRPAVDEAFEPGAIRDEQLRMMFSCCHPKIAEDAQVALVLNVLCGFGAAEIASAFLTGRAAIEKRIARGKRALADAQRLFDLDDREFRERLGTVQRALYLLFNEGYHGASAEPVRVELCREAMRLVAMLRDHPPAATPATSALGSLMCLHAARLPARIDAMGELNALAEQDRSRWDARLVAEGLALLEASASGAELSSYHIEAAIAAVHASAPSIRETDWSSIVSLYDQRMIVAPSPVVALNRAIAISERDGARGLEAIEAIEGRERLSAYPFFHAARGELELRCGRRAAALACFEAALGVARNDAERRFLQKRALAASE